VDAPILPPLLFLFWPSLPRVGSETDRFVTPPAHPSQ